MSDSQKEGSSDSIEEGSADGSGGGGAGGKLPDADMQPAALSGEPQPFLTQLSATLRRPSLQLAGMIRMPSRDVRRL